MAKTMRDCIDELRSRGELVEINEEVDWKYEISAYEVISGRFEGPAFLFNNIKGCPEGRLVVGHMSGTNLKPYRRIAMSLGMDPDMDPIDFYREFTKRQSTLLRPVEVASGPCKEVIEMGKDVNLLEFPFTYHAIGDGGRYNLQQATIVKDPDTGYLNLGYYCVAIYSKNRVVVTPTLQSNFVTIYNLKYQARGESMPVAIVIGAEPSVVYAATLFLPLGLSEYDVAGGLAGAPIEVIRCETSDLLVPANAELVIEGELRPYERLPEGPKIENFGFSTGPRQPYYGIRVHCVTHRKNPILPDLHTAAHGGGGRYLEQSTLTHSFSHLIRSLGTPYMKSASAICDHTGAYIAILVRKSKYPEDYPGMMRDLLELSQGNPGLAIMGHVYFEDDDVPDFYIPEFYEPMFTQINPARDFQKLRPGAWMTIASSWMEEWDRDKYFGPGQLYATVLATDATTKEDPPQGVRRTCFETLIPEKLQEKVVKNWKQLGFKEDPLWFLPWTKIEVL